MTEHLIKKSNGGISKSTVGDVQGQLALGYHRNHLSDCQVLLEESLEIHYSSISCCQICADTLFFSITSFSSLHQSSLVEKVAMALPLLGAISISWTQSASSFLNIQGPEVNVIITVRLTSTHKGRLHFFQQGHLVFLIQLRIMEAVSNICGGGKEWGSRIPESLQND